MQSCHTILVRCRHLSVGLRFGSPSPSPTLTWENAYPGEHVYALLALRMFECGHISSGKRESHMLHVNRLDLLSYLQGCKTLSRRYPSLFMILSSKFLATHTSIPFTRSCMSFDLFSAHTTSASLHMGQWVNVNDCQHVSKVKEIPRSDTTYQHPWPAAATCRDRHSDAFSLPSHFVCCPCHRTFLAVHRRYPSFATPS